MNFDFTDKYKKALIAFFLNEFGDAFKDIESELSTLREFKDELQRKAIEDVECFSSDASTLQDLRNLDLEEIESNLDVIVNSTLLEDLAPLRDFNADSVLSDIEQLEGNLEEIQEALENLDLEEIQEKLENLDLEEIQEKLVNQEIEMKALTQENEELKERLLSIENFLLKTFKGFGND